MEYITGTILNVLEENNITLYSFAKQTGINNSTLFKLLHMERRMKPKYFLNIIEKLPASGEVKRDLTERYSRLALGMSGTMPTAIYWIWLITFPI